CGTITYGSETQLHSSSTTPSATRRNRSRPHGLRSGDDPLHRCDASIINKPYSYFKFPLPKRHFTVMDEEHAQKVPDPIREPFPKSGRGVRVMSAILIEKSSRR